MSPLRLLLPACLALLGACTLFGKRRPGDDAPRRDVRLCVTNGTVGYGYLAVAAPGGRTLRVTEGTTACRLLRGVRGRVGVAAVTSGGGAYGPMRFRETIGAEGFACWHWRVTNGGISQVGPCLQDGEMVEVLPEG